MKEMSSVNSRGTKRKKNVGRKGLETLPVINGKGDLSNSFHVKDSWRPVVIKVLRSGSSI